MSIAQPWGTDLPTFNFSTITAAQALSLTAADTIQIDYGSANNAAVIFGSDTISLTVGNSTVVFATTLSGASTIFADGSRLFVGTSGNDRPLAFGDENNGLYGGSGADTLTGGDGLNQLQGNQGADSLVGGAGYDVIYGGQDNDTIAIGNSVNGGGTNFAQGNKGQDTLNGSAVDNDTLLGGQGNDVLGAADRGPGTSRESFVFYENPIGTSGGGDDFINGNLGNDIIFGGMGNDTLFGEDGDDYIVDPGGRNLVNGGAGRDYLKVSGQSTVEAGDGNDVVNFDTGTFLVNLGSGNDACVGLLEGGDARATIDGGLGHDLIRGGNGADSIMGGADNDVLAGWGGADIISGGDGADEFDFFGGQSVTTFADLPQIVDWNLIDYFYFQDLKTGKAVGAGTDTNYVESSAAEYDSALLFANGQIAGGRIDYVVVQVGSDLYVFADSRCDNGVADAAVRLIGRSLNDISSTNFLTG